MSKKLLKVVLKEDFYLPGENIILEPGDTIYVEPVADEDPQDDVANTDAPETTDDGTFTEDDLNWVEPDDVLECDTLEGEGCKTEDDHMDHIDDFDDLDDDDDDYFDDDPEFESYLKKERAKIRARREAMKAKKSGN